MKRRFASDDDDEGHAVAAHRPTAAEPPSLGDDEGPDEVPARRHRRQHQQSEDEEEASSSSSSSDEEDEPSQQRSRRQQQRGGGSSSGSEEDTAPSDSDNSNDDDDGLDAAEQVLEQRLAEVPFEVLEALHQDGTGPSGAAARAAAVAAKQQVFHRENKNRPQEVSSKRPVSRFREVLQVPKHGGKDPRFEATIGGKAFSKDDFGRRYAFLFDEVLPAERADLRKQLKKEQREGKRRELQSQLTRLQQSLTEEKTRRKAKELEKGWKATEKQAVAAGKAPFYLKKSEVKKRELLAKYEELKDSGRLEKFMAKRRKKNAAKDHRYVPSTRRGDE